MRSRNITVFLALGYYFAGYLFVKDGARILGSAAVFAACLGLFLPACLILQRRIIAAVVVMASSTVFIFCLLLVQQRQFSLRGLESLVLATPLPLYMFFLLVLPGLFLVAGLNAERLPHEMTQWTGLRVFLPLLAVFATRERVVRRLHDIEETAATRGIGLDTPLKRLRRVHVWLVPLASATLCEAAYAHLLREMIGSPHRFLPTRPRLARITALQRVLTASLIVIVLVGIQRLGSR